MDRIDIEQIKKMSTGDGIEHEFLITNNSGCDLKSIEFSIFYQMYDGDNEIKGNVIRLPDMIETIPNEYTQKVNFVVPKDYYENYIEEGATVEDIDIHISVQGYFGAIGPANNYCIKGSLLSIEEKRLAR